MVTTVNIYNEPYEFRGLSTDDKPTEKTCHGLQNGCVFLEMDTSKVFMYDAQSKTWKEI